MLNVRDFRLHVIQPTLKAIELYSEPAERLVLGTALVESNLSALDQSSDGVLGPAYGLYQIEPWVMRDLFDSYIRHRPALYSAVSALVAPRPTLEQQLVTNLAFATAICRVIYRRRPEPLPERTAEQAEYWKRWYNTHLGKGKPDDFLRAWRLAGLPLV